MKSDLKLKQKLYEGYENQATYIIQNEISFKIPESDLFQFLNITIKSSPALFFLSVDYEFNILLNYESI